VKREEKLLSKDKSETSEFYKLPKRPAINDPVEPAKKRNCNVQ
jgi:hypothetical protein